MKVLFNFHCSHTDLPHYRPTYGNREPAVTFQSVLWAVWNLVVDSLEKTRLNLVKAHWTCGLLLLWRFTQHLIISLSISTSCDIALGQAQILKSDPLNAFWIEQRTLWLGHTVGLHIAVSLILRQSRFLNDSGGVYFCSATLSTVLHRSAYSLSFTGNQIVLPTTHFRRAQYVHAERQRENVSRSFSFSFLLCVKCSSRQFINGASAIFNRLCCVCIVWCGLADAIDLPHYLILTAIVRNISSHEWSMVIRREVLNESRNADTSNLSYWPIERQYRSRVLKRL